MTTVVMKCLCPSPPIRQLLRVRNAAWEGPLCVRVDLLNYDERLKDEADEDEVEAVEEEEDEEEDRHRKIVCNLLRKKRADRARNDETRRHWLVSAFGKLLRACKWRMDAENLDVPLRTVFNYLETELKRELGLAAMGQRELVSFLYGPLSNTN